MLKIASIATLLLVLSGCNYLAGENGPFRDRGSDYTEAEILPAMVVPQGLDSYTLDQLYVVPELLVTESSVFVEIPNPKPN
jgi:outer membrane protein assembly factor BamC